ncbi:hypothetical protein B0H17DRAFT_1144592 [Mycena rosella]|uniref:MYND-type domain-containing protein n=1 Tax=Mycena rosella TaxID=1033263 RepID=A0AAD7CSL4_MYCRO|nr:hypothetical protein B0H17DRAFT_1144592 [Mycena rosella]
MNGNYSMYSPRQLAMFSIHRWQLLSHIIVPFPGGNNPEPSGTLVLSQQQSAGITEAKLLRHSPTAFLVYRQPKKSPRRMSDGMARNFEPSPDLQQLSESTFDIDEIRILQRENHASRFLEFLSSIYSSKPTIAREAFDPSATKRARDLPTLSGKIPSYSPIFQEIVKGHTEPTRTIWDQWRPACDACGRSESSLKKRQLLTCAGCLLTKYCSKECQKQDWSGHKNRCHLFEADRKLSTVFAKSLGPGTINDPALSLADKVIQWNFLNLNNHILVACAALKNDTQLATKMNVGIFLKFVDERVRTGSKYDNRTFIIERVNLLNRKSSDELAARINWTKGNAHIRPAPTDGDHCKILVGFCDLPNGQHSDTQLWILPVDHRVADIILPPNFDLHRYITHVNRGVTHFHASFWPLSRDISDPALDAAEQPPAYIAYARQHHMMLSGLKGQGVIGIPRTGTSVFAPRGETDTDGPAASKKQLIDPTRMVRKITSTLDALDALQGQLITRALDVFAHLQFGHRSKTSGKGSDISPQFRRRSLQSPVIHHGSAEKNVDKYLVLGVRERDLKMLIDPTKRRHALKSRK